jgi:hypothetical protein
VGVARELDAIIAVRSKSLMIVSDNGTERTPHAIMRWQQERDVGWHYIAPERGSLMGGDPRLPPVPEKPTLIDFFKYRFARCALSALSSYRPSI